MSHQSDPEPPSNLRSNQRKIRSLLLAKSPSKAQSTTTTTTTTTATTLRSTTGSLPGQLDQSSQADWPEESRPTQPRKYHILTNAGKPVWSTEREDENRPDGDLTSQMGLIQAVISIFEVDNDDQLRSRVLLTDTLMPVKLRLRSCPNLHYISWPFPTGVNQSQLFECT